MLYDYEVDPQFPKKYFNREVLQVSAHTDAESRTENPDFALNQPKFRNAPILVAGCLRIRGAKR